MSGDSVWMSEWVQHPFRLHEPVDAHCREEVQGAAEWWRTGASSPPGGTAAVASGDTKSDDNVATTVFISAAAASSTATAKCIGHDWESSSNEGQSLSAKPSTRPDAIHSVGTTRSSADEPSACSQWEVNQQYSSATGPQCVFCLVSCRLPLPTLKMSGGLSSATAY